MTQSSPDSAEQIKQHILQLRLMLSTEENPETVFDYFNEKLVRNKQFMQMGEPADPTNMHTAISLYISMAALGGKIKSDGGKPDKFVGSTFTELKEYTFTHGATIYNGRFTQIIYFDNIDIGLLAFIQSPDLMEGPEDLKGNIMRFSINDTLKLFFGKGAMGAFGIDLDDPSQLN